MSASNAQSPLQLKPEEAFPQRTSPRLRTLWRWAHESGRFTFLAVTAELGLVLLVANLFSLESDYGFLKITPVLFVGFIVHALLPQRLRLPFFLLLSVACFVLILGRIQTVLLVVLGLGLLGICHLPVAFGIRVSMLIAAALGLAAVRGEWIPGDWGSSWAMVLPVLGAIFMFRLIIYVYELRHEKQPASIWERLAYFFMLPNVCFLLFPVVDYRTYRRTYYDAPPAEIYQKGVTWMFRGATHLLLYRVVYYELLPAASDVVNLAGVMQYMVATYLLYLRISGQFHLVIGILCLFGFNLPETHHHYYLASSFNDYWRRINIYWKDFMMKIFYYPALNALRGHGLTFAVVVATLIVFAGTWLLHSYQWFWLQGRFPLTAPDALFWGLLGFLVVFNSVHEMKRGRRRTLGRSSFSWVGSFRYALKVGAMFLTITILWTLWSSHSLDEFATLMRVAAESSMAEWMVLLTAFVAIVAIGAGVQYLNSRGIVLSVSGAAPSFSRAALSTTAGSVLLLALGVTHSILPAGSSAEQMLAALHSDGLNRHDERRQLIGYYEGLLDSRRYTAARWEARGRAEVPPDWGDLGTSIVSRETDDMRRLELRPLAEDTVFRASFRVNRWGMRDGDYEREKPESTFRIAMIGASYTVGAGVEQEEIFEARIEDRLNSELAGQKYTRFESLNFAVGGYDPIRTLVDVRRRVADFEPDLVCYVVHSNDDWRMRQNIVTVVERGLEITEPHVAEVVRVAGIHADMPRSEMERRLNPLMPDLLRWSYGSLSSFFAEHGISRVAFVLPQVIQSSDPNDAEHFRRPLGLLREAGFEAYNLAGVYKDYPMASLWLGPWDEHPNPLGHQLIADRIYQHLVEDGNIPGAQAGASERSAAM